MATRELRVNIVGDTKSLESALGRASASSSKLGRSFRTLGKAAVIGVGAAFAGLAATLKVGFDEMAEGHKVAAQKNAVLKSTGGIANVAAKDVDALAQAQSDLTGIDDELVQQGENLLLTFKNVRNEVGAGNAVFDRATKAALDLSTAGFGSVESASKMMGKALNDPIRGMTALSRAGVTFSDSQKETITSLVETGRTLEAQKLILAEVESQVGGSAKAYGETLPGQLAKVRNSFSEVAGELATTLLPYLTQLLTWVNAHMPEIKAVIETTMNAIVGTIRVVAPIIGTLIGWFQRLRAATEEYWPRIQAVVQAVIDWFRVNVVPTVRGVVSAIMAIWRRFGDDIVAVVRPIFQILLTIIDTALRNIKAAIELVMALIRGDWDKAWSSFKTIVSNTFGALREIITTALRNLLPAVVGLALALGRGIVDAIARGLQGLAGKITGALAVIGSAIASVARSAFSWAVSIGVEIVNGILSGLGGLFGALKSKLEGTLRGVLSSLNPFSTVEEGAKKYIADPIVKGGADIDGMGVLLSNKLSAELREALQEAGGDWGDVASFFQTDTLQPIAPEIPTSVTDLTTAVSTGTEEVTAFGQSMSVLPTIAQTAFSALLDIITRTVANIPLALDPVTAAVQRLAEAITNIGSSSYWARAALKDTVADIIRLWNQMIGAGIPAPAWWTEGPNARALGGPVTAGTPYVVGEAGPELFIPRTSGRIVSSVATGRGLGGAIVLNFYGPTVGTGREFEDTVRRALYDVSRRNPGTGLALA